MIRTTKEFQCLHCNGIKTIEKHETPPIICPFCGKDKHGRDHWKNEWTLKKKK